jgi:hypothetical protein
MTDVSTFFGNEAPQTGSTKDPGPDALAVGGIGPEAGLGRAQLHGVAQGFAGGLVFAEAGLEGGGFRAVQAYSKAWNASATPSAAGGEESCMAVLPQEPQALEPFVHAGQGGVERTIEVGGDLAKLLALVNALANHLTLSGRKAIEQVAQASGIFPALGEGSGARSGIGKRVVRRRGQRGVGDGLVLEPPLAEHGLVVGHGEKPAAKVAGMNVVEPLEGPAPGFLKGIFGLVMVAEDADQELEKERLVAQQKRIQGAWVAGAETGNQVPIRMGSVVVARRQ